MPGPYAFKQIFAADPSNTSNVAKGGSVLLFAPGDASRKPLVLTDLANGMVLPNPVPINSNGFGPAFLHETLPQVAWEGGGFSGTFESFEGMRADAVAAVAASQASAQAAGDARVAAETAAGNAAAGAAGALAGAVAEATAAKAAAQQAAGLVGAPAGDAVLAAIQPGGAAYGALSGTYALKGEALDVAAIAYDRGRRALAEASGRMAEVGEPVTFSAVAASVASTVPNAVEMVAFDRANMAKLSSLRILRGDPQQHGAGYPNYDWLTSKPWLTNSPTPTYSTRDALFIEFDYDGAAIDLAVRQGNTDGFDAQCVIRVDGKIVRNFTASEASATGVAGGSGIRLQLVFNRARKRTISIDFKTSNGTLRALYADSTKIVSYPSGGSIGPKVVIAGDSFGEGDSALPAGRSFLHWLGPLMQWPNIRNVSSGSTGYFAPGTRVPLKDRWQHDIVQQSPNIVIVPLGINDLNAYIASPANVTTAAQAVWDGLKAQLPDAELVIIGPFSPRGTDGTSASDRLDADLKALADARGLKYISPISEKWITGTGRVGALKGDGNADIYTSSDGTHPTAAGHKYLAWRIAGHLLT